MYTQQGKGWWQHERSGRRAAASITTKTYPACIRPAAARGGGRGARMHALEQLQLVPATHQAQTAGQCRGPAAHMIAAQDTAAGLCHPLVACIRALLPRRVAHSLTARAASPAATPAHSGREAARYNSRFAQPLGPIAASCWRLATITSGGLVLRGGWWGRVQKWQVVWQNRAGLH